MAFAPLSSNFKFGRIPDEALPVEYRRPGYTGVNVVNRQVAPCKIIIQTGYCIIGEVANLLADEADATVTVTVDALNLGSSYPNCYKYRCSPDVRGVPAANVDNAGTNGLVAYQIEWHQLAP